MGNKKHEWYSYGHGREEYVHRYNKWIRANIYKNNKEGLFIININDCLVDRVFSDLEVAKDYTDLLVYNEIGLAQSTGDKLLKEKIEAEIYKLKESLLKTEPKWLSNKIEGQIVALRWVVAQIEEKSSE